MGHGSRSHARGLLEVGFASVLWGTGGLAVQLIREQQPLSAVRISAWRMALAAAVLLVALLVLRRGGELLDVARARPRQLLAVEPVTAAVVAAVVLDESLGPVAVVGTLLVLGAVAGLGRPSAAAGPVLPDSALS